ATSRIVAGERVVLDGTNGHLIVRPTAAELTQFADRSRRESAAQQELASLSGAEAVMTDGERVTLRANVDLPDEAVAAAASGAEGVGLMRTEFLVVGRAAMPTEDEQVAAYSKVVKAFGPHPIVIRTYDVGGDKLPIGGFPHEANPFLGWRAIRMCLDEPELFKDQLRALLRAGLHGDIRIMLPLIVTVDEVRTTRRLLREAASELESRGVAYQHDMPLGVMVETPAAAVAADTLVGDVAFFSIGTNDLVQYTLAVDRGNVNLASRFTPLHPAVLRLIKRTVDVGNENALDVTVCGEMASQPLMAFALLGLGVRTLSVNPHSVPLVKYIVRGVSAAFAAEAANAAVSCRTAAEAEHQLKFRLAAAFGDAQFLRDGLM
ncbi:MAG: phosphoenolpyruvate--protein phosphotransferase, partial [Gemmatimonadaceae bacterium]